LTDPTQAVTFCTPFLAMIGTIRKHSAWLWAIVITATIASFVTYFRPGARNGGGGGGGDIPRGHIGDTAITQSEYANAYKETELRFYFSNGDWPDRAGRQTGFDTDKETYFRLFLIQKAKDLHLNVGVDETANEARGVLQSINRGQGASLADFEKEVLQPHGLSIDDFERSIRHDLEIRQIYMLMGSSGELVTPQEAQLLYTRDNTEASVQAAFFSQSNFLSQVSLTPESISQFYSNQAAYYRLPDRVQVKYVEFPLTNYWAAAAKEIAKITNVDEQFQLDALQRGTNYFGGAANQTEARKLFDARYQEQEAGILARREANDFSTLLQASDTNQADYLVTLAAQKGYTVKTSEPFDSRNGPTDFSIPLQFAEAAFHLTTDQPFTSAIPGEKAVYVMALDKQLPSELPSLPSIYSKVTADLTRYESTMYARQATVKFFGTVTNALATGKSFQVACEEAHVQPQLLPPFSLRTESNSPAIEAHIKFETLKEAAFTVLPGHANYAGTDEGGAVLYVVSRLPVDTAKMNAEMPYFLTRLRQSRESEAFNLWFSREAGTALRDVPSLQKKQEPAAPQ